MDVSLVIALVCAVISTVVAIIATITDRLQWGVLKYIKSEFDARAKQWEENGTIGEQLTSWMMHKDAEGDPTNLEVMAGMAGRAMLHSAQNTVAGIQSGNVRKQKSVDGRVFDAIQANNPKLKALTKVLEALGLEDLIDPELLPLARNSLEKFAGFNLQNNGGSGETW